MEDFFYLKKEKYSNPHFQTNFSWKTKSFLHQEIQLHLQIRQFVFRPTQAFSSVQLFQIPQYSLRIQVAH